MATRIANIILLYHISSQFKIIIQKKNCDLFFGDLNILYITEHDSGLYVCFILLLCHNRRRDNLCTKFLVIYIKISTYLIRWEECKYFYNAVDRKI